MTTLRVNGHDHVTDAAPDTPLLYVLRDEMGLSGPQYGCGAEQCGACKVLLGARAVPSCRLSVQEAARAEIVTLEGLTEDGELHPVQQAFIDEQAAQCGYCTNGMVVAGVALVTQGPTSEQGVRRALADNLCRCGSHPRVIRAICRASVLLWDEA